MSKSPADLEWMTSSLFQLSVKGSATRYNVHRGLLEKAAPVLLSKGFREGLENHYTFEDTEESAVKALIEWAYFKDYTILSQDDPKSQDDAGSHDNPKSQDNPKPQDNPKSQDNPESKHSNPNPFLLHAYVYILGSIYFIEPLKKLAFTKLTWSIEALKYSYTSEANRPALTKLTVLFAHTFDNRLPDNDPLLAWLGNCAAYRITDFLQDPNFRSIAPMMSIFILPNLEPSWKAPWERMIKAMQPRDNKRGRIIIRDGGYGGQECSECGARLLTISGPQLCFVCFAELDER